MKKSVGGAMLLVLLVLIVAGCTSTLPVGEASIQVTVVSRYSHPIAALGGYPVSLQVSGGTGQYTVDWGDGSSGSDLSHLYLPPIHNQYTITVRSGNKMKIAHVQIQNTPPKIYPLALNPGWMEKTALDLRYQVHGCKGGRSTSATGIYDPDGDATFVVLHVYLDGAEEPIFDTDYQSIQGKKVPVGVYYWFPGWTGNTPPYPFGPAAIVPAQTQAATLWVTAIDQWGGKTTGEFKVTVAGTGCKGGSQ